MDEAYFGSMGFSTSKIISFRRVSNLEEMHGEQLNSKKFTTYCGFYASSSSYFCIDCDLCRAICIIFLKPSRHFKFGRYFVQEKVKTSLKAYDTNDLLSHQQCSQRAGWFLRFHLFSLELYLIAWLCQQTNNARNAACQYRTRRSCYVFRSFYALVS